MSWREKLNKWCNINLCTCFFDGNWGECCAEHDKDYIHNPNHLTKWQADKKLFNCVRSKAGIAMASIMWVGNQIFSWYFWRVYNDR